MISIIREPLISEKTIALGKRNFYTFLVDKRARKPQVAKAVSEMFNVEVLSVKMMTVKPVSKVQRTRKGYFQVAAAKKAIITVKTGQKIDLFDLETKGDSATKRDDGVIVTTAEGEPVATEVKEKKSLLKRTKVKIERPK